MLTKDKQDFKIFDLLILPYGYQITIKEKKTNIIIGELSITRVYTGKLNVKKLKIVFEDTTTNIIYDGIFKDECVISIFRKTL